jgi:hypothetical protein
VDGRAVTTTEGRWDWTAIRAGGSVALVFAVPLSIAARIVADNADDAGNDGSGIATLLAVGALVGFFLGAGVAAWYQQRGTPLSHGVVTATGTFVVAQAALLVVKLARGGDVDWLGIMFNLTMTAVVGVLGGVVANAMIRQGARPNR